MTDRHYEGFKASCCDHCRNNTPHTAEQHTAQCVVRALPVGSEVIIGDWVVSHTRFGRFVLTGWPVKMGGRTRFGTIAEVQEDLAYVDKMGCLPPIGKVGF